MSDIGCWKNKAACNPQSRISSLRDLPTSFRFEKDDNYLMNNAAEGKCLDSWKKQTSISIEMRERCLL